MDQSGPNGSQKSQNPGAHGQERVILFKSCLPMPWELVDAMSRRWRSIAARPPANERNPQPSLPLSSVLSAEITSNQNRSNMVLVQSIVSTELSDPRRDHTKEHNPRSSRQDYSDSGRDSRDSHQEDDDYNRIRKYQREEEYYHRKEREPRRELRDPRREVRDPRHQPSSQRLKEQILRTPTGSRDAKIQGHAYHSRRDSISSSPNVRLMSGSDSERTGEHRLEDYSHSRRKRIGPRTPPGTPPSSSSDDSYSP